MSTANSQLLTPASPPSRVVSDRAGYTLYLVLVVLTIAGTLFTISLTSAAQVRVLAVRHLQGVQAQLLAASGLQRTGYFLNGGDGHDLYWETEAFVEPVPDFGEIHIRCLRYGAFSRVSSTGIRLEKRHVVDGLLGRDRPAVLDPLLTLTGHSGGLTIDGGTTIGGKITLHHGAVVRGRARIPVRGFRSWADYRESPSLPFDVTPLADFMAHCSEQLAAALSDTAAVRGNLRLRGRPDNLWRRPRIVVLGDCLIEGGPLENATVIAAGSIRLAKGASCIGTTFLAEELLVEGGSSEQCLFFANSVTTIEGGTHASQFFCNDSIKIGNQASQRAGSIWVSHRHVVGDTALTGGVFFSDRAHVVGQVICYADTGETHAGVSEGPSIVIGPGSTIEGALITDGDIDIQRATVRGHLWARAITTLHNNTGLINVLYDCHLKPADRELPFPLVGELPARVRLF